MRESEGGIRRLQDLRGYLALWIMFGHCCMFMSGAGPVLKCIQKLDLLCVGLFFFLSGYGLFASLENKKDYLRSFLLKHPVKLVALALISCMVNLFIQCALGHRGSAEELAVFYRSVWGSVNRYVWEQCYFYLVFFVLGLLVRNRTLRLVLLLIPCVLLIEFTRRSDLGQAYYVSTLAFPAGAFLYEYGDRAAGFYRKHRLAVLAVLILLAGVSYFSQRFPMRHALAAYGKNLLCVSVCFLAAALALDGLIPRGNSLLTKLSLGIYLYHLVAINAVSTWMAKHDMKRGYAFMVAVALLTMFFALCEYGIRSGIGRLFGTKMGKITGNRKK